MRYSHRRESYIPENADPLDCGASDAAIYVYQEAGKLYAIGFHGRAQKPDWHHKFRNPESLARHCQDFISGRMARAAYMAEYKAKRAQSRKLNVGDILRASWGYDQTNVDFYQVTALVGKTMVEIRKIGSESVEETGFMQGRCMPARDNFIGKATRHKVHNGDSVTIDKVSTAYLWDGKPSFWSSYA